MTVVSVFDVNKCQTITDKMIALQDSQKFQEAAELYLKTINDINSMDLIAENSSEWISNLLSEETIEILMNL